jgi:hypothetical protein
LEPGFPSWQDAVPVITEGPLLETLTRRLAECPGEFLEEPFRSGEGVIHVDAVVFDLLHDLTGGQWREEEAEPLQIKYRPDVNANYLKLVQIAVWLLHDHWFMAHPELASAICPLLTSDAFKQLARTVSAAEFVNDPDRREELARLCLNLLDLRPAGESKAEAKDRLTSLDSVERTRVMREARKAEKRAAKIRREMARKAREEAAAKVTRE